MPNSTKLINGRARMKKQGHLALRPKPLTQYIVSLFSCYVNKSLLHTKQLGREGEEVWVMGKAMRHIQE